MKYVFFVFLAAYYFSSCNKETTAPDSPLPILENTFINYRFKDKYTTAAQLVSKLSVVVSNIDSVIQPKYDVTAFRIFIKPDFQNHEVIASRLVYVRNKIINALSFAFNMARLFKNKCLRLVRT